MEEGSPLALLALPVPVPALLPSEKKKPGLLFRREGTIDVYTLLLPLELQPDAASLPRSLSVPLSPSPSPSVPLSPSLSLPHVDTPTPPPPNLADGGVKYSKC